MNKRTKALDISPRVKKIVWERDGHCCIICGSPYASPCCHYIPRSQGGLGIEQNIFTGCETCHMAYDQSTQRAILRDTIADYLRSQYKNWDDIRLTYLKGD